MPLKDRHVWNSNGKVYVVFEHLKQVHFMFFFFRGTFHYIFNLDTRCTYSCIGTSGKKLLKPPWEGFSKNHCRDYLKCLPCLNSSLHCNKHNLQLSALSYLMIWEQKIQLFKIKRWSLRGRVSKAYYYSRGFGASVYSYQYWPSELSFLWKLAVPLFSLYLFCQLATIIQDTKTRNQTIASWFTFLLKNSTI